MHRKLVFAKQSQHLKLWSATEREKVKDMFFEGYSDAEIGEVLGRTAKSVGLQRYHLNLHKAHQPHKEFRIHDAMADYFPTWYKKYLLQQWKEQQQTSTKS